jgi:hypothetical protein
VQDRAGKKGVWIQGQGRSDRKTTIMPFTVTGASLHRAWCATLKAQGYRLGRRRKSSEQKKLRYCNFLSIY